MNDSTQQFNDDQQLQMANTNGQEYEIINGVACPIDPQERLQCESCQ